MYNYYCKVHEGETIENYRQCSISIVCYPDYYWEKGENEHGEECTIPAHKERRAGTCVQERIGHDESCPVLAVA